jgi:hypothetical protein
MGRTIPSFRIARALEKADFVSLWKLRLKKKRVEEWKEQALLSKFSTALLLCLSSRDGIHRYSHTFLHFQT